VNGWLGAALGSELDGIMKKITPAFGGAVDLDPDALRRVLTLPEAGDLHELDHFLPLLEALLANEQVSFEYRKSAKHPVEHRHADPLQLALQEGAWLLVTRDHARGEVRRFRLSRIQKVKSTGATFESPRDFDVKKYLRESLGRYGGTEEHEVRLALDAYAANYAREKAWHPSQQLTEREDGGVDLTLRLNHLAGAKHLALTWAEHVEVLSPPALREEVRKSLTAALAKYR
jgi:predicted DNA-binding transcriptional regulator YafY